MPAAIFETREPSTAVQVTAVLGDSVVSVSRVSSPGGAVGKSSTRLLLVTGTLLLLGAAGSFAVGLNTASDNAVRRTRWRESGEALDDWRPARMSPGYDWLLVGGSAVGFALLMSGLWRVRDERRATCVRMGSAPGVDIATSHGARASLPLVAPRGDHFVAVVTEDMAVRCTESGAAETLSGLIARRRAEHSIAVPGAWEIAILRGTRITAQVGRQTLFIAPVEQSRWRAVSMLARSERRPLGFLAGSAMTHLAVWALLSTIPPDPATVGLEFEPIDTRVKARPSRAPAEPEDPGSKESAQGPGSFGRPGQRMALDEGLMGSDRSTRKTGRYALKTEQKRRHLTRGAALAQAREAGMVGVLRAQEGDAFASITGSTDFSSGFAAADVSGGLLGTEYDEMAGGFGFGQSGFGQGGGGTGWGTIGTAEYGDIGHGGTIGSAIVPGYNIGLRKARRIRVRIGRGEVSGGLPAALVKRYLKRGLPDLIRCHKSRELAAPDVRLHGTVHTRIVIGPGGGVMSVVARGVDLALSTCFADAIGERDFPLSDDRGMTTATYPVHVYSSR